MKALLLSVSLLSYSAFAATDYFVAVNGDDARDGKTRETAKATLAGAVACLADQGDRVIVTDGVYSNESTTPLLLTNGWSIVGENGAAKTKILVKNSVCQFKLASADTEIRGLTIDFSTAPSRFTSTQGAGIALNPRGTIADCEFCNYKSPTADANVRPLVYVDTTGVSPIISNCTFRSCSTGNESAAAIYSVKGLPTVVGCTFADCAAGVGNVTCYGIVRLGDDNKNNNAGVIRNSIFLRCSSYSKSAVSASVIFMGTANAVAESCTLIDCQVKGETNAGMIGKKGKAYNCLVYRCTDANGDFADFVSGTTCSHCAAQRDVVGDGNVKLNDGDLEFACEVEGRYAILSGPTIDVGVERPWMSGATDIAGNARVVNGIPDIGCYEFVARPKTYYVATDGDDMNDGLTRMTAKATLAAAVACLTKPDERVLVTDGVYTNESETALLLTNGWSVVGENGASKAKVVVRKVSQQFNLASVGTSLRGLTIDYGKVPGRFSSGAALAANPRGTIADCEVCNYNVRTASGDYNGCPLITVTAAGVSPTVSHCTFRSCATGYGTACVLSTHTGQPTVDGCSFVDCAVGADGQLGYGIVRMGDANKVKAAGTLRNCLFLRCSTSGTDTTAGRRSAIVYLGTESALAENCSLISCKVRGTAVGGVVGGYDGTAVNCLVYDCANGDGTAAAVSSALVCNHCAAEIEIPGDDNITLEPGSLRFKRAKADDYTVVSGPTIDAGVNQTWMANATDVLGNARIVNEVVDIGCYEYGYDYTPPGLLLLLR